MMTKSTGNTLFCENYRTSTFTIHIFIHYLKYIPIAAMQQTVIMLCRSGHIFGQLFIFKYECTVLILINWLWSF